MLPEVIQAKFLDSVVREEEVKVSYPLYLKYEYYDENWNSTTFIKVDKSGDTIEIKKTDNYRGEIEYTISATKTHPSLNELFDYFDVKETSYSWSNDPTEFNKVLTEVSMLLIKHSEA